MACKSISTTARVTAASATLSICIKEILMTKMAQTFQRRNVRKRTSLMPLVYQIIHTDTFVCTCSLVFFFVAVAGNFCQNHHFTRKIDSVMRRKLLIHSRRRLFKSTGANRIYVPLSELRVSIGFELHMHATKSIE